MPAAIGWRSAAASDPGILRPNNEDRVYADDAAGVFLVVDGMGGRAAGELAAETAIQVIPKHLESSDGDPAERVRQAITLANNEIYRLAQEREECRGMACVLTLAVAHEDQITLGHVGDSRLYLVWNGTLRKLTSDHSPVGEWEEQGELTEAAAMSHPRRNEVFRDVGSKPREANEEEFIQIKSFPFRPGAALLLCTDGLSDMLTSAVISSVVERYCGDPEITARELVAEANRQGGKDNISVIFVAGPEFLGSESEAMSEARARHSVTQAREIKSWWRRMLNRLGRLLDGRA
ncbi:MAG: protein phosphatase 2C domain-containing protein [Acidobacteriia bacterium]|nr:protein phosphatase 2C domain-containing protein [Terriglobia bacterium]